MRETKKKKDQLSLQNCALEVLNVDKKTVRETSVERNERNERDAIREERRREREKERRLEEALGHGYKRSKLSRDCERDVSERVALGMAYLPAPQGYLNHDQRLFNQ